MCWKSSREENSNTLPPNSSGTMVTTLVLQGTRIEIYIVINAILLKEA